MRIGLALPHYDHSVPGETPLSWETLFGYATRGEAQGFDSLWMSDHLFWDIGKYGGPSDVVGTLEPIVALGALARSVTRPRLGTLVLCEALRPATVLAKALATVDLISGGRLDVGIGAGYYEPEYRAIGMELPPPSERLARLAEAVDVLKGLLGGGPLTYDGRFHRAVEARNLPPARQEPRPPVFVGGKGDRLLGLVAERADGWNTCWILTPAGYAQRLSVLDAHCERVGRDPATVWRSLGLYALCGVDEADLERRFRRLAETGPPGVLDGVTLDEWRQGRLVGTVEEVREQAAGWAELGVETLILSVGSVPFAVSHPDDVELLARTLCAR